MGYTSFILSWPIYRPDGKPENVLQTTIRLGNQGQDLQQVVDEAEDTGKFDKNKHPIMKWGSVEFVLYVSSNGTHKIIDRPTL